MNHIRIAHIIPLLQQSKDGNNKNSTSKDSERKDNNIDIYIFNSLVYTCELITYT